jgi:hypothetical protein
LLGPDNFSVVSVLNMKLTKLLLFGALMAGWIALARPADAQLQPQDPDPLARMRAAAASQAKACTVKEPSACAEATPKIVANALASPQLAENLARLSETGDKAVGKDQIAAWTETAFRDAGVDDVHTDPLSATQAAGSVNVVAEIRGREKPGEFVVLGARLPSGPADNAATDEACNAALVIEAARDIHLTGLRPMRSIRFVLFEGESGEFSGSRTYVESHRADLDHAIAAVIFERGCGQANGFSLGGRHDVEPGVREAFAVPPIDAWHVGNDTYDAPWGADNLDFLLEGVPTLMPNREMPNRDGYAGAGSAASLGTLKHNSAIAGVLAFALAEHPDPLGPRLSRAEVATLLKKSDLETPMKAANIWQDWEDGKRGRRP